MNRATGLVVFCVLLAGVPVRAQTRIDLSGDWERWVGGKRFDTIRVPSSYRPMGTVTLRRAVNLPNVAEHRRVLLHFEGVAYAGLARVNGKDAGELGPWTPHEFDVTGMVKPGNNQVDVELTDWQVALGPIGAWESYGGIIRDVYLETRTDPYIENAHLQYTLTPTFDAAKCTLDIHVRSTKEQRSTLVGELREGAQLVATATSNAMVAAGESKITMRWDVSAPELWSPENPSLYTLLVRVSSPSGEDRFERQTGFRDLQIRGDKFILNGKNLILRGVCRHDLWKDQGYTLNGEQIDRDVSMIKSMGANFIRLVHYPHNRQVIEAAARRGLFVTEESGLVWLDFKKLRRETVETGLRNLEQTVKRDWNNPALFAVLLANESAPTLEVVQEGRRRIRALAPSLFMSSARVDGPERTLESSKRIFDEGGLDFYTDHPYGYDMGMFERSVTGYSGKPMVFTEWGGRAVGQSPIVMKETTDEIGKLLEAGRLAGYSFWSWADLPEFSREDSELVNGILESGVVTEDRKPRPEVYLALMELNRRAPHVPVDPPREPRFQTSRIVPLSSASEFTPISLQAAIDSPDQQRAASDLDSLLEQFFKRQGFTAQHWQESGRKFWTWSAAKLMTGAIPFVTALKNSQTEPVILTPGRARIEIPIQRRADRLYFLGNVTVPNGYPVIGIPGGRVARYTIVYTDGDRQEVPLRWGLEVARSNMIAVATRINPIAANSDRVITFVKHPTREVHQTLLLPVDTKPKQIDKVICELDSSAGDGTPPPVSMHHSGDDTAGAGKQALLLYAITAETAAQKPR
jgi:hypothetical protein